MAQAPIKTDLVQQPATGGAKDVPVVIAVNADGSSISGGGSGGAQVTGEVRLQATASPEGTKMLQTLGEYGQTIVEVAIWGGDSEPSGTLKQPITNAELRATAIPVSGPLTNAQFIAVTGAANAAMWDGTAASATLIAILKNMQEQGEALKRIGNETNTLMVQVAEHTRQIAFNTAPPTP